MPNPRLVLSPTLDFRYGAVTFKENRGGWMFTPNVNNRRPSRRVYPTAEAAIPRWARPYRLQEVHASSTAQPLLSAGEALATLAALSETDPQTPRRAEELLLRFLSSHDLVCAQVAHAYDALLRRIADPTKS